ncbi:MAG: alpha/beta hydrolase, partial [Agromyces sp.]
GVQRYYDQSVDWTACGTGFDCARITAPLDWDQPGVSTISLAIVRHRATEVSQGAVFVNPGGPGGSGYRLVRQRLESAFSQRLRRQFDIIGFDPRGVGRSSAVSCGSAAVVREFVYPVLPGTRGDSEWIAAKQRNDRAFGAACASHTGALLGHVDTVSAARDLDLLRAVTGQSKLNYLGFSYGTSLGATYASIFPKRMGRFVLDGAVDPALSQAELTMGQAKGFEVAARSYLSNCLTTADCPFAGKSVNQAMSVIRGLLESADRQPQSSSTGRVLTADVLFSAFADPLYSRRFWPLLTQAFTAALSGDVDGVFAVFDAFNSESDATDNAEEAMRAITCLDYPVDASADALAVQRAALDRAAPTFGTYFAYDAVTCAAWPVHSSRTRQPISASGSPLIVVVGTTRDPATPYQWAQNLSAELDSSTLVTYVGDGHTAYMNSSCVTAAVDEYLLRGVPPKPKLTCSR